MNTAVLVVDMVNEFVTGKLGGVHSQKIVTNIKKLLEAARRAGLPVVYITDAHLEGIDREFEIWGSHAVAGSDEARIIPELESKKGDYRLYKRSYSAFYATGLDALLREIKVETIVLTGVLTNICIQHTAADAFMRNYKVIVSSDGVNALTSDEQETSLNFMKRMYHAKLTDTETIIRTLEGSW